MKTGYAASADFEYVLGHDHHLSGEVIRSKIERDEVIVIHAQDKPVGWLRFNYFWDEIPFMNMLFVDEAQRGKGYARGLIRFWEQEMQKRNFRWVMTSTLSNENAQHLYRKLGYRDCGSLFLPDEPLEIILMKQL